MTPERFRTLVDAYGAQSARWPDAERADALAWADAHRTDADALLADADALDAWLAPEPHTLTAPDALFERIVASAPVSSASASPASRDGLWRRFMRGRTASGDRHAGHASWWWSGAAFAGAGVAGGMVGALAVSLFAIGGAPGAPGAHESYDASDGHAQEASYLSTSFGGSSADWSDQ